MAKEQEHTSQETQLTGIYINFVERAIEFEDAHGTVGRIAFTGETVLIEGEPLLLATGSRDEQQQPAEPGASAATASEASAAGTPEKVRPVTLSGRLKSTPKEGRLDRQGNPTAWARLAVHEDDREDAHLYLATFHRHTVTTALGLASGAQITVDGYPHLQTDGEKRLDTLSVIALRAYPGKPEERQPRQPRRSP